MKTYKRLSFSEKLVRRNCVLTLVLLCMIAYMIIVSELGLGDSRSMSELAERTGRFIFFGGMIWVIVRIIQNRKLLKDRLLLREKFIEENDEMNRMRYEKTGGVVWDVLLVSQLFITLTTSLMNNAAFYSALASLAVLLAVKGIGLVCMNRQGH